MKSRPIKKPINPPKPVARIIICGAVGYTVTDQQNFIKPNPEQIANLKRLLNIDVELLDKEEAVEEVVEEETATLAE
jgi:hypothetical protein